MLAVVIASLVAVAIAFGVYLGWERLGTSGLGMAALRAAALIALAILLFNPSRTQRVRGGPPTVLLDASLSMSASGGHWQRALDTARALAANGGVILRFGREVAAFDTSAPSAGVSSLGEALRVAAARSTPIIAVTDGVIDDAETISPGLMRGVTLVLVPRDTVPDAALMDVAVEPRVQRADTVSGTLLISTAGPLTETTGNLSIFEGTRRLATFDVPLPKSPGVARRPFRIPAGQFAAGPHVLRFALQVTGDAEPGDDVRLRTITVTEQAAVVVLVSPADWEGRFLTSTLNEVAHTTVRGFAQVRPDRWVDMRTLVPVGANEIRTAVRGAALVIARGDVGPELTGWRGPLWRWPAGTSVATQSIPGDWYIDRETPSSPVGGRFASVEWDSVPPLDHLVPMVLAPGDWVGLQAKLGRRGSDRAVLVGRDTMGVRLLTTGAEGLYRWGLRGGASREAYRAIVAGGVDWLLGADATRRPTSIASTEVVSRGTPVAFRWGRGTLPDSAMVRLSGPDTTLTTELRFDADGIARVQLDPGIWRWALADGQENGIAVVEEYSDEFRPRPVSFAVSGTPESFSTIERRSREWWWIFLIAVIAFCAEWAWRLRRGLP